MDWRHLGRRCPRRCVVRALLRRYIVGCASGRLALDWLLLLLGVLSSSGRLRTGSRPIGGCGLEDFHRGISLGGNGGFLLECGSATGREVVLMMGTHRILGGGIHGGIRILRILHGNVAIPVSETAGARHGGRGGGG
jgi:hypothetical protein